MTDPTPRPDLDPLTLSLWIAGPTGFTAPRPLHERVDTLLAADTTAGHDRDSCVAATLWLARHHVRAGLPANLLRTPDGPENPEHPLLPDEQVPQVAIAAWAAIAEIVATRLPEILDAADRRHEDQRAAQAAQDGLDTLRARARQVRADRETAAAFHRRVMFDVGALTDQCRRLTADFPQTRAQSPLTDLSGALGVSRPTMNTWAERVTTDADTLSEMSNTKLAAAHAGYHYGGHDQIDAEFWSRYPHLDGWHAAMMELRRAHREQWLQDHPDADPTDGPPTRPPGLTTLSRAYREAVDHIATGELTPPP